MKYIIIYVNIVYLNYYNIIPTYIIFTTIYNIHIYIRNILLVYLYQNLCKCPRVNPFDRLSVCEHFDVIYSECILYINARMKAYLLNIQGTT